MHGFEFRGYTKIAPSSYFCGNSTNFENIAWKEAPVGKEKKDIMKSVNINILLDCFLPSNSVVTVWRTYLHVPVCNSELIPYIRIIIYLNDRVCYYGFLNKMHEHLSVCRNYILSLLCYYFLLVIKVHISNLSFYPLFYNLWYSPSSFIFFTLYFSCPRRFQFHQGGTFSSYGDHILIFH